MAKREILGTVPKKWLQLWPKALSFPYTSPNFARFCLFYRWFLLVFFIKSLSSCVCFTVKWSYLRIPSSMNIFDTRNHKIKGSKEIEKKHLPPSPLPGLRIREIIVYNKEMEKVKCQKLKERKEYKLEYLLTNPRPHHNFLFLFTSFKFVWKFREERKY